MENKYVILKSPVKIGECERVASYAGSLTKGEEQLLITRDLKFFLTDGKGGYLEFKSINSGITVDEVTQRLTDLNNSLSQNIEDLDTKTNSKIISLQDAVNALNLKFDSYVTTTEFDNLKTQVESNTTLATHANRDTLNKFSEDTNGNPLFNGKKIVADFDTSGIEAEIADLNNRSVIGESLDYGMFGLSGAVTVEAEAVVPFNLTYMSNNISVSNGIVTLKKGKKYEIKAQSTTNTASNNVWFTIKANSATIGKSGWCGTVNQVSIPCTAIINCKEDTTLSIVTSNAYNIDAACAQMTYLEVMEVGRTTIIDPAEDAKIRTSEYGYFKVVNQSSNISSGDHLEFDMIKGNMAASTGTGQQKGLITLKANKKYKFVFAYSNGGNSSNGVIHFNLCDLMGNVLEDIPYAYMTTYVENTQVSPTSTFILEPTTDTVINFKIAASAATWVNAYLTIEEIAQPYYFNYYKDSLITTNLFTGNANTKDSQYTLIDDLTKYQYLIVYLSCINTSTGATCDSTSLLLSVTDIRFSNDGFVISTFATIDYNCCIEFDFIDKTTFQINSISVLGWENPAITKIDGIGYNYENPYRDVVSSVEEFTLADIEVDSAIIKIWNEVGV